MNDAPASPSSSPSAPAAGHGVALALGVAVVVAWLGVMALALRTAALPPETGGTVLAVFPPGTGEDAAFAALVRAGGEPLRKAWPGFTWVVRGGEPGFVGRLHEQGVMAAYGELPVGPQLGGCAAVSTDAAGRELYRLRP